jgi:sn-glycerol 3-phosphate transport system ATP-binding protein
VLTARDKPGSIPVNIEFIDDMGADKLVQVRSVCDMHRFSVRTTADMQINHREAGLELIINKTNLFHKKTGLRLGGWHGETSR